MERARRVLVYLFIIIGVTVVRSPTVVFCSSNEPIVQYIIDISKDIHSSIKEPKESLIYESKGELKLKLFLSPWGELKDAFVSESSGNKELDDISLNAAWFNKRYPAFPEVLGEDDLWVEVPVVFDVMDVSVKVIAPEVDTTRATTIDSRFRGNDKFYPTLTPGVRVGVQGKRTGTIDKAIDIALENHMPAKISEEEIELSNLKIREARRALFPAASLSFLNTTGKTTGTVQDFTDREYKLKFEYPLYYSWRLKYAVDQAISNMKASRHNYDRVLQDLRLEIETAFYSYAATSFNRKLQHSLLQETQQIFDIAEKRYDVGLTTRAEFLQVNSQLKQISYQIASSENELELARFTLAQAMNLGDPDDLKQLIDIDSVDIELAPYQTDYDIKMFGTGQAPVDIDLTLEDCVDLAFGNRPDLKSKEYAVEVNDYERKIAKSKDQVKVDFTGSVGSSGGAYETEDLNMSADWYVGLKVSKPLGGNTATASYTTDETSEKHGQSSRTQSTTMGAEFGILDNMQSFSEKKSAEIALKKAKEEYQQTKEAVYKEVKESYLNYKKGLIQGRANLNKVKQREEELKIAKARAELNEIPLSEFIKAHMNLTDEKSFYIEAVGSLYQSLAKLNKATGYTLFLDDESFMLAGVE